MVKLIVFIIITCLAVVVGPLLADSQGYIHIATASHVIETSITTAIILYLSSIFALYFLCTFVKKVYLIPKNTLYAFRKHSFKRKLSLQDEAIISFEQGQYDNTLALLKHSADIKKMSEKSLLVAAQAAFHIGLYDYTRQALDEAQRRGKQAKLASDIVRAKLNYDVGNAKVALECLDNTKGSVKNAFVYKLYLKCFKKLNKLSNIVEITPSLLKYKVINDSEARDFYLKYIESELRSVNDLTGIDDLMKKLSKNDKKDARIMGSFVYKLIQLGDVNKACQLSLSILKKEPDRDFLNSISNWEIAIPEVLVALKKYASKNVITTQVNLPLLKAMANLEFKSGLLKEAYEDYKQALSIEPSCDIYLKLGSIQSNLQNYTEAAEWYAKVNAVLADNRALALK